MTPQRLHDTLSLSGIYRANAWNWKYGKPFWQTREGNWFQTTGSTVEVHYVNVSGGVLRLVLWGGAIAALGLLVALTGTFPDLVQATNRVGQVRCLFGRAFFLALALLLRCAQILANAACFPRKGQPARLGVTSGYDAVYAGKSYTQTIFRVIPEKSWATAFSILWIATGLLKWGSLLAAAWVPT